MKYFAITLFPEIIKEYAKMSILGRAEKAKLIKVKVYQLREYTKDKHGRTDGKAYGGGPGMVLWVDPIINNFVKILSEIKKDKKSIKNILVVNFIPGEKLFNNNLAKNFAKKYDYIIFICGRYEGVDARVNLVIKDIMNNYKKSVKEKNQKINFKIENISIGEYILTGGELPTMIMIDSISRQIKGVLHDNESLEENRVASSEVYARPEIYERRIGDKKTRKIKKYLVPKVLLSGHHENIENWRKENNKK